jgi:GntR family transcriptional regulator, transcriptional repressor for pyruvate dehydrogenase complex
MQQLEENRPRQGLTHRVIAELRGQIDRGELKPGDKLPTEQALVRHFGVSRTVIREAIAGLRADGLVLPRQGVGVFVLEREAPNAELPLLTLPTRKISDIIESLELRTAVEVEAAGLAAARCLPAQEAEIHSRLRDFEARVQAGEPTTAEDFAFHVAVAEAANNQQFKEFLAFLGRRTIPRSQLRQAVGASIDPPASDDKLYGEHCAIFEAILARDPEAARAAMRRHLAGSMERYRALIRPTSPAA